MSFRTRLQAFVDNRQKIQIWYGMGCHNTVTGRVLGVDHDHIDVESYSHENDGQIHVRRILVPLHLILHIDITSSEMVEEEELNKNDDKQASKLLSTLSAAIDLPDIPTGYGIKVFSQLNSSHSDRFSRMTLGPGGTYFACDGSVWFIDQTGHLIEYARIRGNSTISGLCFDSRGILYVTTIQGTIYRIDPNKSGRVLAHLAHRQNNGEIFLADLVIGPQEELYVSNCPSNNGGIFKVEADGEYKILSSGPHQGTQGLLLDQEGFLWGLEHETGTVVKRALSGSAVTRIAVSDSQAFNFAEGFDGNLAMDSLGRLYVTAGRAGSIIRVNREGRSETFLTGLVNPTGIAFGADGALLVLEAGRSRVLKVGALDKADRAASARALS